ncbi:MAG: cytidylate kinase [Actinobacteria bacterium BACL4 MAG-120820-bin23]|jgi:GTPase|nr:MAG: cytidylate kinase [Actinobacteria bacterium BACL4 MAG-120820-bin23]KRO77036.1 MAG: cytidylate kinase [Actinobacteria bacterium BACL4 MAG-120920-bin74]KRO93224.1 MAG: cytidylate kinase [Actinobacteria bacterium BACL4 MAG-120507-bin0]HCP72144.1 cytidylate kinase [Actinomycetota bacterium]
MSNLVLAIDGPSGSGKSSTAKAIAIRANWSYLDTGALYRAVTLLALEKKIDSEDSLMQELSGNEISFETSPVSPKVLINGKDVSVEIRMQRINDSVSEVSAMPQVRNFLLEIQRKYITQAPVGIVVEGRDIGTVVAPHAQLKIYLHADIDARAKRREIEMLEDLATKDVEQSLSRRDEIDSTRAVSPLSQAEDAAVIDSTRLTLDEVTDQIWKWLKQRNLLGLPTIAVIGRPNVGKSTLVNRMIGRREAIVEDTPGVTRDRVKYEAEWNGRRFFLIDTGGWEVKPEGISEKITAGAEAAISEADLIMFVVDTQVGALDEDQSLVDLLRKSGKKILLVANKIDNAEDEADGYALWNLGLGEPRFVSALHGRGSGDLLDLLIEQLPEVGTQQVDDGFRRVALVGRPNVGKSSLLNALAGSARSLVDDAEGTTRDAVDELIEFGGSTWRFIDTAGIRRRAHQASGTDYYASLRTQIALERSEVALIIFDASQIITEQDIRIVSMADEAGKALVIVMNKWDLVDEERQLVLDREIDRQLERYPWAQRVNLSAKTGWHRDRLAPALRTALTSWEKRIPTAKLNAFLGELVGANPPPVRSGKQPKIKFATQAGTCPPKFVIFATEFLESAYRRFIERRLREDFGFIGTPIEVAVKLKDRDNG